VSVGVVGSASKDKQTVNTWYSSTFLHATSILARLCNGHFLLHRKVAWNDVQSGAGPPHDLARIM
jgi:hypothetical protein